MYHTACVHGPGWCPSYNALYMLYFGKWMRVLADQIMTVIYTSLSETQHLLDLLYTLLRRTHAVHSTTLPGLQHACVLFYDYVTHIRGVRVAILEPQGCSWQLCLSLVSYNPRPPKRVFKSLFSIFQLPFRVCALLLPRFLGCTLLLKGTNFGLGFLLVKCFRIRPRTCERIPCIKCIIIVVCRWAIH